MLKKRPIKMPKYVAVLVFDQSRLVCKKVHKHWPKKTAETHFVFGVRRSDGLTYEARVWRGLGNCPRTPCVAQEVLDSAVESVRDDPRLESQMRHPARARYVLTT